MTAPKTPDDPAAPTPGCIDPLNGLFILAMIIMTFVV